MSYYSIHTHSQYSAKDAFGRVSDHVARAAELGYPALALTDHGTIAGAVQLYQSCREVGIEPLPGVEAYFSWARHVGKYGPATAHMGLVAITESGYRNLVRINNLANEHFRRKPVVDITDLYEAKDAGCLDGLVCTTGCFFGVLGKAMIAGDPAPENVLTVLRDLFGDNLYVEIQHHGIYDHKGHDEDIDSARLADLASRFGLPVVLGGDSHYIYPSDKPYHDVMKRLNSWSDDPDDAMFPGESPYCLRRESDWRLYLEPNLVDAGLAGLADILDKSKPWIPELETFSMKVPPLNYADADKELADRAWRRIQDIRADDPSCRIAKQHVKYDDRLVEELEVISAGGFSEYMLLVSDLCQWMEAQGLTYGIRGSAAGSLVAYLTGIGQFDPVPWNLDFARFLSTDRTKPPDIDIDVADDERERVMSYLSDRYVTRAIGTWSAMSAWEDHFGDLRGKLPDMLFRYKRKTHASTMLITDAEREALVGINARGALSGQGRHAAGLLVAKAEDIHRIPMAWLPGPKVWVTAYDKDDVEAMGYTKLDILGLKLLRALRIAAQLSGVPLGDANPNTSKMWTAIGKGKTAGMFQLAGYSMRRGCMDLKPRNVRDLQIAMALFRPAVDDGLKSEFLRRRRKESEVPAMHQVLERHLSDTYGIFLFQEQLIGVLRDLGMKADELTAILKAVKSSNKATDKARVAMAAAQNRVISLCQDAGLGSDDTTMVLDAMSAYAEYGFNRAHATSYAFQAAISGYYAVHHPVEFWTGMLTAHAGDSMEQSLYHSAVTSGVKFYDPHVNYSGVSYTIDRGRGGVRMPLTRIDGIGESIASEIARHAPYSSIEDFTARVNARIITGVRALASGHSLPSCGGAVSKLASANAFKDMT